MQVQSQNQAHEQDVNANVARYYRFANLPVASEITLYESPAKAHSILENVRAILGNPDLSLENLGYHCSEETHARLAQLGHEIGKFDGWSLDITNGVWTASLYSGDRALLVTIAEAWSKLNLEHTCYVGRWARYRFIYWRGELTHDHAEVPYTNVDPKDWL